MNLIEVLSLSFVDEVHVYSKSRRKRLKWHGLQNFM